MKTTSQPRLRLLPLVAWGLLLAVFAGSVEGQRRGGQKRKVSPEARLQWQFGVDMASRGLWSEALFRFDQARRIEPEHPGILSNIAVAHEALGLFEEALGYYREALRLAPRERDVRRNYSRFVEYYQNFRGDAGKEDEASAEGGAGEPGGEPSPAEEGGADSGTPEAGPAQGALLLPSGRRTSARLTGVQVPGRVPARPTSGGDGG